MERNEEIDGGGANKAIDRHRMHFNISIFIFNFIESYIFHLIIVNSFSFFFLFWPDKQRFGFGG